MKDRRPSSAWRLSYEDGLLLLTAGADRLYALDDVGEVAALQLLSGWERGSIDVDELTGHAREVAEELIEVGALRRSVTDADVHAVGLRWVGDVDEGLQAQLRAGISESPVLCESDGDAELMLFLRTTGRLVGVYETPEAISAPHLLVDLAYHHTVSLGPLVVAGETACLACLAGRIGQLWGDPEPPPRPVMLESPRLVAALAVRELERAASGDARLANATAAYDFDAHSVVFGAVYKLPWCPVCGNGAEVAGRVELPWSGAS